MTDYKVEFYQKENGEKPVENFLESQNKKMRAKLSGLIEILEESGPLLRQPYSKHLDDGIFELRCIVGSDIIRVLYFFYYNKRIILTNGFIKKTNKTPKKEIELAKKYRKEFLRRNK